MKSIQFLILILIFTTTNIFALEKLEDKNNVMKESQSVGSDDNEENSEELETIINYLEGQLTGTVLGEKEELEKYSSVIDALQNRVGRIIFNGVPTGVEVCPAMLHGGPYPSSTDSRFTAVGLHSVKRWVRPFSFQSWPNELLPAELKNNNPLGINRFVNGLNTSNKI